MDDLIRRQDAIKLAIDLDYESRGILKESKCREIENRYNMIPTAEPERKRGEWIDGHCSNCGCDIPAYIIDWKWQKDMDAKFCPNCGSDMRGENNG